MCMSRVRIHCITLDDMKHDSTNTQACVYVCVCYNICKGVENLSNKLYLAAPNIREGISDFGEITSTTSIIWFVVSLVGYLQISDVSSIDL